MVAQTAPIAFETVARFSSSWAAWTLRNELAEAGLDAFVHDENLVSMNWFYTSAIGGIKVQVPGAQAATAREVISSAASQVFSSLPRRTADTDAPKCRKCGSTEIHQELVQTRLFLLLSLISGIPIPVFSSATECYDCGHRRGPPTTYGFRHMTIDILLLIIVALVLLAILRQIGDGWFNVWAMRNWLDGNATPTMLR